jgi:hypothetical protein
MLGLMCSRLRALANLVYDALEALIHAFHSDRAADQLWAETSRRNNHASQK